MQKRIETKGCFATLAGKKSRSRAALLRSQEIIQIKGRVAKLRGRIEIERGYAEGKRIEIEGIPKKLKTSLLSQSFHCIKSHQSLS